MFSEVNKSIIMKPNHTNMAKNRFSYAIAGAVKTAKAIFPILVAVFTGGFVYDVVKGGPSPAPEETKQDASAADQAQE